MARRTEGVGRRRRVWTAEDKARIVAETREPGASVALVARRNEVNANMLFGWRRQLSAGPGSETVKFVQAQIVDAAPASRLAPPVAAPASVPVLDRRLGTRTRRGIIEIRLCGGHCITVEEGIDPTVLRSVLDALGGRR